MWGSVNINNAAAVNEAESSPERVCLLVGFSQEVEMMWKVSPSRQTESRAATHTHDLPWKDRECEKCKQ